MILNVCFAYIAEDDVYRCLAEERLARRCTAAEHATSKTTKIKYKLLRLRIDLARPALLLIDRLLETNSECLLKPRRTEIRFRCGAEFARLSGIILPESGENLDLAETPAQTPNREAGPRRAQIGIEVGKAHEPHTLGRKA